ncbi:hypothetical protein F5Y00DRAFT_270179 [Daldinia vernicosa]|uniref:uncharacterized protein n=1 Tax=Daldinia vernicosa TaxID=114800 RepID=UPI002007DA1D|nr:uncharacterized protein F5Y00DRAFT_270179 [Daldinia vernicosa]KAI0848449.1 hypothetical protein F5Y00DRAFT_270179 [Daldinia vernicosa]
MSFQRKFQVTSGGEERVSRVVDILGPAFEFDPVFRFELQNFSLAEQKRILPKLFHSFFFASAINDGMLLEADNFGSCAILMPPGKTNDNFWTVLRAGIIPRLFTIGPAACKVCVPYPKMKGGRESYAFKRIVLDYPGGNKAAMAKALTPAEQKAHWYVFIMATAVDRRREGLASALLVYMKDKARSDGRPLWIEATTVESRDLYAKHGFEVVTKVNLGKGQVGPDGLVKKDGEGVTVWPMVWRPEY